MASTHTMTAKVTSVAIASPGRACGGRRHEGVGLLNRVGVDGGVHGIGAVEQFGRGGEELTDELYPGRRVGFGRSVEALPATFKMASRAVAHRARRRCRERGSCPPGTSTPAGVCDGAVLGDHRRPDQRLGV
jgi:hypothetical protein